MCAIAHNGNTRQKWTILQSDYLYCIYFRLLLLYNLKFLYNTRSVNGNEPGHGYGRVSVHRGKN